MSARPRWPVAVGACCAVLALSPPALAKRSKDQRDRKLALGVGVGGGFTAVQYGSRRATGRDSAFGGGGVLLAEVGYYVSPRTALVLDTQLNLQGVDVGDDTIAAVDALFAASVRGHTRSQTSLLFGLGLSVGHRSDADSTADQSAGFGVGLTAAADQRIVQLGKWRLTGGLRFTAHIFPGSDLDVTMLQWWAVLGFHRF